MNPTPTQPRAVCLVSGGMDSAVTLAEARLRGFEAFALSFNYGQRHAVELEAAAAVAEAGGASLHRVIDLNLSAFGGSALTDDIDVPKEPGKDAIPVTYVPARNTVFLSVALAWAEVLGAQHIFLGVNAVDYSGYPDCRPEFLDAFRKLANLATAAGTEGGLGFHIEAPLLKLSKAQITLRCYELGVDAGLTHTCYDPIGAPAGGRALSCGRCDACVLRLAGFEEAGLTDPIPYV